MSFSNKRELTESLMDASHKSSFSALYPDIWTTITNQNEGAVANQHGVFLFKAASEYKTFHNRNHANFKPAIMEDDQWKIVVLIPDELISDKVFLGRSGNILIVTIFLVLLALVIYLMILRHVQLSIIKKQDRSTRKQLEMHARTDLLTGLSNRRHFYELGTKEMARARRYREPFSISLLDIDHFKQINDTYGHDAGDMILASLAHELVKSLRLSDSAARFGGEEFILLMPATPLEMAIEVCERIRAGIEERHFRIPSGEEVIITISLGVATMNEDEEDFDAVIKRADIGLYKAKNSGRNQVVSQAT